MKGVLTELEKEVLTEYDQVLIGNQRTVDRYYFDDKTDEVNQQTALLIIRHVVEDYLKWSPQKMRDSMTMDIIRQWKLAGYLRDFITFPPEFRKEANLWYLAHLLYPNIISASDRDVCIRVYCRLLDKEIQKFPKGFFSGPTAMNRVCYCLNYAIDNFTNFTSVEEMYDFFGSEECIAELKRWRLYTYVRDLFDAPIVPIYMMANDEQERPYLFQYYRFWQIVEENRRAATEKRGKPAVHRHAKLSKEDTKYVQVDMS